MLICFGSTPSLASFSRNAGSLSASCVTSCSLSTMLRGVLAGADSPFQKRKTAFGYPASAIDGTSGRSDIVAPLRARPAALGVSVGEEQSHYCDTEQNKTDRAHAGLPVHLIPDASSWRMPPSQPHVSARSRGSVCGLRDTTAASTSTACPRAMLRP